MIEVTKSAFFEEVANNVKQNWKLIAKRYILAMLKPMFILLKI